MSLTFPSTKWFEALADRMAAQPEKYRKLGPVDLTLVPRIVYPDGATEEFPLVFAGHTCRVVERERNRAVTGTHAVVIEGEYAAWREMVDAIRDHGGADGEHTLNYLTLPDTPLRLIPVDESEGQLAVDRFYRYIESLQQFFNEAANVQTGPGSHG